MNGNVCCELRPVLRRPRQEWIIPAMPLDWRSAEGPEPVTQAPNLALWKGTTAQGREIMRKMLFFIQTRFDHSEETGQVIGQVEARLNGFSDIFPELTSIFLRLCGRRDSLPEGVTVHDLATLMVLRVRLERASASISGPTVGI